MPSDENDHHDRDDRVKQIVDDRGRAFNEEGQEADLNRVGDHRQDPRGEDASPGLLHVADVIASGTDRSNGT